MQIFKNLVDMIPELLLPWQADEYSLTAVDGWSLAVTDIQKKELIKAAIELHAYKGTPWSIREIIRRLGYGEISLETGLHAISYDGTAYHDGGYFYGDRTKWALYRIRIKATLTNEEARFIRTVLRYFAPAHCTLFELDYQETSLIYDGSAHYDGVYNHGVA